MAWFDGWQKNGMGIDGNKVIKGKEKLMNSKLLDTGYDRDT